jgi:hypothetical protein
MESALQSYLSRYTAILNLWIRRIDTSNLSIFHHELAYRIRYCGVVGWTILSSILYLKPISDLAYARGSEDVPCPDLTDLYDRFSLFCIH